MDKIEGAVSAADKVPAEKLTIDKLNDTVTLLLQGLVNQHYDIARMQLLMDHVFETHKEILTLPTEEVLAKIESQAIIDAKKTYPQFFKVDK